MLPSLTILIFDDTLDNQEGRQNYSKLFKTETLQRGFNSSNTTFQRINIRRPIPLNSPSPKQSSHIHVEKSVSLAEKQIKPSGSRLYHIVAARNVGERKEVNNTMQKQQTKLESVYKKADEEQPALEQEQKSKREVSLPLKHHQPDEPETEWKPPPNAGKLFIV